MRPLRGKKRRMNNDIYLLAQQGLKPVEIAREVGVSRATVYRRLRNTRIIPDPPRYANPARNHLVSAVHRLVKETKCPVLTAARIIIAQTNPDFLHRASDSKRPVTPRRLASWTKP